MDHPHGPPPWALEGVRAGASFVGLTPHTHIPPSVSPVGYAGQLANVRAVRRGGPLDGTKQRRKLLRREARGTPRVVTGARVTDGRPQSCLYLFTNALLLTMPSLPSRPHSRNLLIMRLSLGILCMIWSPLLPSHRRMYDMNIMNSHFSGMLFLSPNVWVGKQCGGVERSEGKAVAGVMPWMRVKVAVPAQVLLGQVEVGGGGGSGGGRKWPVARAREAAFTAGSMG